MPSHLAAPSARAAGPSGGAERPGPGVLPAASTRRALRAERAERGEVGALPGIEELLAADEALGGAEGADVLSPHGGRGDGGTAGPGTGDSGGRGGSALVATSATTGPATPTPAPLTRREARRLAETSASRPAAPATHQWSVAPAPVAAAPAVTAARGGSALALAERPAPSTPWDVGTTSWSSGSSPLGFTAELELSGLRALPATVAVTGAAGSGTVDADAVIVLPQTPLVLAHGAPPAPLTRRARREIEELERALALPAASPGCSRERHLMAVALSPDGDLASDHLDPVGLVEVVGLSPGRRRPRRGAPARSAFGLPQAGMVGVLGLAVLVGPSLGQVAHADTAPTPAPTAQPSLPPTPIGAVADLPAPAAADQVVPTLAPGESVPLRAEELLAKREQAEQASRAIGERTEAAEAAARADAEREAAVAALVPGCDGQVGAEVMRASNGELPDADLCVLWDGDERLRPDAAMAMARLDMAYREAFGTDVPVSDAYRSYGSQVEVRRTRPGLSARPGTSQHGWGVAVDLGGTIATGGEGYRWLMEHAGEYGWENPAWARPGGSGPHEPWHWEYAAGRGVAHTG